MSLLSPPVDICGDKQWSRHCWDHSGWRESCFPEAPPPSSPWGIQPPEAELTFYLKWSTSVRKLVQGGVVGEGVGGVVLLSQKFTGFWLWYVAILSFCKSLSKALVLCPKPLPKSSWGEKMILTILICADTHPSTPRYIIHSQPRTLSQNCQNLFLVTFQTKKKLSNSCQTVLNFYGGTNSF